MGTATGSGARGPGRPSEGGLPGWVVTGQHEPCRHEPSGPTRRPRARRGEGDRLREEILAAAGALLATTGDVSALSTRAIAAAAGVTPPSIYLHFADRAELVFAVCENHWLRLVAAMDAAACGIVDPIERIRCRGEAYLRFGVEHPEHYRVLMMGRPGEAPEHLSDGRLAGTAGIEVVASDLREAILAGALPDQDATEAAVLLWMAVHGLVSLLISKPGFPFPPLDVLYAHLFEVTVAGLGGLK